MNAPELHDFPFDFEWRSDKQLDFFEDQDAMAQATQDRRNETRARFKSLTSSTS